MVPPINPPPMASRNPAYITSLAISAHAFSSNTRLPSESLINELNASFDNCCNAPVSASDNAPPATARMYRSNPFISCFTAFSNISEPASPPAPITLLRTLFVISFFSNGVPLSTLPRPTLSRIPSTAARPSKKEFICDFETFISGF